MPPLTIHINQFTCGAPFSSPTRLHVADAVFFTTVRALSCHSMVVFKFYFFGRAADSPKKLFRRPLLMLLEIGLPVVLKRLAALPPAFFLPLALSAALYLSLAGASPTPCLPTAACMLAWLRQVSRCWLISRLLQRSCDPQTGQVCFSFIVAGCVWQGTGKKE